MNKRILKFPLNPYGDSSIHTIDKPTILHVGEDRDGQPCVWVEAIPVPTKEGENEFLPLYISHFSTVFTGEEPPYWDDGKIIIPAYIGSIHLDANRIILHIYQWPSQ